MSLLLDFIVIAVLGLCIYTGVKRGFIRSVMSIVVLVLAVIGSIQMMPAFSKYLRENYVEPMVTSQVESSIESLVSGVESIDLDDLFEEQPQAFTDILDKFGMEFDKVKNYFEKDLSSSAEAEDEVSSYIAAPLAETISDAVAFTTLFFVLLILLRVVMLIIDLAVKIPVLNGVNKSLGLIFGILKGALYAWGLSVVFCRLLPHLAVVYEGTIPASVIDSTIVVKFLGAIQIF